MDNFEEVKAKLAGFVQNFSELIKLAESGEFTGIDLRPKYGYLKSKLRLDRDRSQKVKVQKSATESETCFYYPAVSEAANALPVPIGGKINNEFIASLYDSQSQIEYYLNQMVST